MKDDHSIREWAERQFPELDVVSASEPEPVLIGHNLVAVGEQPELARRVVLAWERLEPADGAVGLVVMGRGPDAESAVDAGETGADPEGVAAHAGNRIVRGGVPGAIAGAVVVGLFVLVLGGWSATVIGAAAGGAALGFVFGAVLSFAKGTGWGPAYEQSFVDESASEIVFASIHSDDPDRIDQAAELARDYEGVTLYFLTSDGQSVSAS